MEKTVIETAYWDYDDDKIAKLLRKNDIKGELVVIVGEGRPEDKIEIVEKHLTSLCKDRAINFRVIQGFGSDKESKYPNLEYQPIPISEIPADSEETILKNYREVYTVNPPNRVYMMKWPREALRLKLKCPNTEMFCCGDYLILPSEDLKVDMDNQSFTDRIDRMERKERQRKKERLALYAHYDRYKCHSFYCDT